ncbi:MAG: response regulator transcription factor [Bacteroidetes bacterium]|jgi:DNA-binding response OmpR family regulator|nr:response regulator transcription factor [Bacteroidota bacterium]MDA0973726.1 response regulator transcription factor [Bacteroidota bacterium]
MKTKKKILYVEDDPNLGFVVQDGLQRAGYLVHLMRDGKSGLHQFNSQRYDLCILDVMLPEKDGFSLAKDIRVMDANVPILFLTARSNMADKEQGYGVGGDDYLTKPFEQQELELKIRAILRRNGDEDNAAEQALMNIGDFNFQPMLNSLKLGDTERKLTKTESKVLDVLLQKRGEVIERHMLLNLVWGRDDYHTGRSLDVYISKLRKYLSEDPRIQIENIHGVGFRIFETD